jgi:AsmA-like C-terminal region/AsmA family
VNAPVTKKKWQRWILIAAVILLGASEGFSRALQTGVARRYLVAHLAASFGRPVEVSWFDFSLLDGARVRAHYVTVAEDPQFGNEYFLRADALAAGLRWSALLAGRVEFGSVSLQRPSLNLVRNRDGQWNVERWLPPAHPLGSASDGIGQVSAAHDVRAARLYRINVSGGRINFKRQDDKSPFALIDVSGRVEQNAGGRWQLDLEARPMRAGVELQDSGIFGVRGSIAGTTSRLQPAEINLTWRAASLADALRLLRQNDYGMRGQLAVDLDAQVAPKSPLLTGADSSGAQWSISGVARLTGIHGWRLPERGTEPAVNLSVDADWRPGEPRAAIRKLVVQMPESHLQATGDLDWAKGFQPQLHIESSTIGFVDVLSWYRALLPGVADDLRAQGALGVDVTLGKWPVQLQQGAIASVGATLNSKSLPAPFRIGPVSASVSRGGLDFAPTEISFAASPAAVGEEESSPSRDPKNSFVLRGSISPRANGALGWPLDWNFSVEGATSRVQDWLVLSGVLAQPANSSWGVAGGLAVKVRGTRRAESATAPAWLGTLDSLGLTLSPPSINQPLRLAKAHVEFASNGKTITLAAAQAFGAVWNGTLTRKGADAQWTFDLSADRLDASELDRWLGPRARPGFFARLTGLGSSAAAPALAGGVVTRLAARGRLRIGEIDLPPVNVEQFDGEAEIAGRTIRVRKAQGSFFQGKVYGSFDARLLPDPSYEFQGSFDRVNLAQLARAVPFLNDRIGGIASGSLTLSTHGIGRQNLVGSLEGKGTLNARSVELRDVDLSSIFPAGDPPPGPPTFSSVQVTYSISGRNINLSESVLDDSQGKVRAVGRIDFSHALNLQLHSPALHAAGDPGAAVQSTFLLSGTIENPKLIPPTSVSVSTAKSSARSR